MQRQKQSDDTNQQRHERRRLPQIRLGRRHQRRGAVRVARIQLERPRRKHAPTRIGARHRTRNRNRARIGTRTAIGTAHGTGIDTTGCASCAASRTVSRALSRTVHGRLRAGRVLNRTQARVLDGLGDACVLELDGLDERGRRGEQHAQNRLVGGREGDTGGAMSVCACGQVCVCVGDWGWGRK